MIICFKGPLSNYHMKPIMDVVYSVINHSLPEMMVNMLMRVMSHSIAGLSIYICYLHVLEVTVK